MCKSTTDTSVMACKCVQEEKPVYQTFAAACGGHRSKSTNSGCAWCDLDRLTAENAKLQQIVAGRTCFHSGEAVNEEVTRLRAEKTALVGVCSLAEERGLIAVGERLNEQDTTIADLRRQLAEQSAMINSLTRQVGEEQEKQAGLVRIFKETSHRLQLYSEDNRNRYITELIEKAEQAEAALATAIEELDKAREELKAAEEENLELVNGPRCGDCDDTGLLNNCVEGDYYCTCITETKAYEKFEAALEQARLDSHLAGMEEAAEIGDEKQQWIVADAIRARITEIEEKKHAQS